MEYNSTCGVEIYWFNQERKLRQDSFNASPKRSLERIVGVEFRKLGLPMKTRTLTYFCRGFLEPASVGSCEITLMC